MRNKITLLIFLLAMPLLASAQTKIGPTVRLGYTFPDKTSKIYNITGGICPAFGITMQNEINYWLSIKSSLRYSFSQIKTVTKQDELKDQLKGQFLDLIVAGRFSGFDESSKLLPYGIAGLGNSFNLLTKGAELYLSDTKYKGSVPFFTVGAGTGIKMSFFSEFDLSVTFSRYLAPVLILEDNSGVRMNMVSFEVSALF